MTIDLYTVNIRRDEMMRQAEHERLARSITNHRRPALQFNLRFSIQWKQASQPLTPILEDAPSPCG